eukprot:m.167416 g.167416  ORF g.167416 m.167416 type:complete len:710 (+) comp16453_c0_seq4:310-2439(+)
MGNKSVKEPSPRSAVRTQTSIPGDNPAQRAAISAAFQHARRGTVAAVVHGDAKSLTKSTDLPAGRTETQVHHLADRTASASKSSPNLRADAQSATESTTIQTYIALYDYKARTENEMSFSKGDHLHVLSNENENWWQAEHAATNAIGWIPSNYVAPLQSLDNEPWYHGRIARTTAEYLLSNGIDGSFLVRESQSSPGEYSISMRFDGKVFHYRVSKGAAGVFVAQDKPFPTLSDLVKYHQKSSDGLVFALRHPVKKKQAIVFGVTKEAEDQWEIDRSTIKMGRKLGSGQYGEVYEAVWTKCQQRVAVKTLKEGTMDVDDFLKEANVMKGLRHNNLVQLIGVCTRETPLFIITEFMVNGNLLDYLRDEERRQELDPTAMMHMAAQIAAGMAHLEDHNFIHRDLAARNCLVGENLLVKLADFGLARILKVEDIYTAKEGSKFPIKWTAPESLNYNVFTIKSDVWAFGVCLWEIATFGETPYPGMDLYTVLERLDAGYRMPRPQGCPLEVYKLMRDCWTTKPEDRPSFREIKERLESMYSEGTGIEEEVSKTLTFDNTKLVEEVDSSFEQPCSTPQPQTLKKSIESAPVQSLRPVNEEDRKEAVAMTKALFKRAHHLMRLPDPAEVPRALGLLLSDTQEMVNFVSVFARCGYEGDVLSEALTALNEQMSFLARLAGATSQAEELERIMGAVRELARRAKAVCDAMRSQESAT